MKIAIAGSTGQVGKQIVDLLIDENQELVLLSRNGNVATDAVAKGATLKLGNLGDVEFLTAALKGVDTFYVMLPPDNGADDVFGHYQTVIDAVVSAIQINKISRVVLQSSYGAQHAQGTGPIVSIYHAEKAISAVCESFFALRNGYFMENFKWMAAPMKTGSIIPLPVKGQSTTSFVATRDIAKVAAEVLVDESWAGHQVREVLGSCDLSFEEVAGIISQAAGREIKHFEMSDEMTVGALTKPEVGFSADYARLFIELHRAIDTGHLSGEHGRESQGHTFVQFADFAAQEITPLFND